MTSRSARATTSSSSATPACRPSRCSTSWTCRASSPASCWTRTPSAPTARWRSPERDLPDKIKWVKFSEAEWTPDGKGFYYSRYDEPGPNQLRDVNYFQKLYYHRLGAPQSAD